MLDCSTDLLVIDPSQQCYGWHTTLAVVIFVVWGVLPFLITGIQLRRHKSKGRTDDSTGKDSLEVHLEENTQFRIMYGWAITKYRLSLNERDQEIQDWIQSYLNEEVMKTVRGQMLFATKLKTVKKKKYVGVTRSCLTGCKMGHRNLINNAYLWEMITVLLKMAMIGGSVLCFETRKTIVTILVIAITIFLTHAIRPFKDDFSNDLVIMFSVVQFFGAIAGVHKVLQWIFVLVTFMILLIVGITGLRGAHASITKQQKLKALLVSSDGNKKKNQFTPLEQKLLLPFFLLMRPARVIAIRVVLMLGIVVTRCGCAKIAKHFDKKVEKRQKKRRASMVKQRSLKQKRQSTKIYKPNDKNQYKVPKSLKAGTDMISIMMFNEDATEGTQSVNVRLKVPKFLLENRMFAYSEGIVQPQQSVVTAGVASIAIDSRIVTNSGGLTVRQTANLNSQVVETLPHGAIFHTQGAPQIVKGHHRYQLRGKAGECLIGYVSVQAKKSVGIGASMLGVVGDVDYFSKYLPKPEDMIWFSVPAGYSAGCDLWIRKPCGGMRCITLTGDVVPFGSLQCQHGSMGDWAGGEFDVYSQTVRESRKAPSNVNQGTTLIKSNGVVQGTLIFPEEKEASNVGPIVQGTLIFSEEKEGDSVEAKEAPIKRSNIAKTKVMPKNSSEIADAETNWGYASDPMKQNLDAKLQQGIDGKKNEEKEEKEEKEDDLADVTEDDAFDTSTDTVIKVKNWDCEENKTLNTNDTNEKTIVSDSTKEKVKNWDFEEQTTNGKQEDASQGESLMRNSE